MNECLQQKKNNRSQKGVALGYPFGVTNFNWGHYFWGLIWGQF